MAKKPVQRPVPRATPASPKNTGTASAEPRTRAISRLSLTAKLCVLLALISCALYYNTLQGGYVLDDVMVVKDNSIVRKGISAIPELLATPHLKGYLKLGNDTYRPLSLVVYAALFPFAGEKGNAANDNTAIYHGCNILVFAGCVVLLFLFLDRLFRKRRTALAFMAALLFAVHPLHTEVVANIKSLDELLCFFFAFLSLYLYAGYAESGKIVQLIMGAVTLYMAYLSKETVIAFLFVVPFVFYFYLNDDKKRSLLITATATVAGGIFLFVRWMILTKYQANVHSNINFVDNFLVRSPTPMSRLATEILILGKYLMLHLIPYPLISDYSYRSIDYTYFTNIWVWTSLLVYVGMIVIAVMRFKKDRKDPLVFGIVFYFATMALFSNIPVTIGSALAERFTFYCSAGICIALAFLIEYFMGRSGEISILTNRKVLVCLAPVTIVFGLLTIDRNADWKDDYSLYKADFAKSPDNIRLAYDLSNEMEKAYEKETNPAVKKQMIQQSMANLRKALAINPNYSDAHFEIGVDFFNSQQMDSAILHFKRSIALNPKQSNAMFNLATVYMKQTNYADGQTYYHRTIEINPDRFPAIFNEGVCYYYISKFDSAIYDFKKTIVLAPEYYGYKSFNYTAIIYKALGKMDSALRYEQLAKVHDPSFKM